MTPSAGVAMATDRPKRRSLIYCPQCGHMEVKARICDIEMQCRRCDYKFEAVTEDDKTILAGLEQTVKNSTEHLDNFRLHEAAQEIYQFTWRELADVYLEKSKAQILDEKLSDNTRKILLHQLTVVLKLLHPFMPFITEEIWQKLNEAGLVRGNLLMIQQWPK